MQKGFFIFAFRDQETIMKVWLLFIFGIVPIISQAQNRMISGEVTDKEYNPIEFVTFNSRNHHKRKREIHTFM